MSDDMYRDRDRLVGGTENVWVDAANFNQFDRDDSPTVDQRADDNTRFSGTLSQSDLAS